MRHGEWSVLHEADELIILFLLELREVDEMETPAGPSFPSFFSLSPFLQADDYITPDFSEAFDLKWRAFVFLF